VEGILTWWLAARGAEWSREQMREVLESLVARHILTARGESLENRVYGLDLAHAEEMERFLLELERER
jgi:hypothetical protein